MPTTVADLRPAAYNPRNITKRQLEALGKAMKEFGDLSGLVVNLTTGHIVGGHQRLKHLDPGWGITKTAEKDTTGTVATGWIQTPWGRISYREVEWPLSKEKAANIAANAHGGEFEMDLLKPMLAELKIAGLDIDLTGLDDGMINRLSNGGSSRADDYTPKCRLDSVTKTGDLYMLGKHRLLCGDAQSIDDVARLMNGCYAQIMWTDPPYGVSYVGKQKDAKTIQNDDAEGIPTLLLQAFARADEILDEGSPIYVAHPPGALSVEFGKAFIAVGWRLHETLIWVKDSMVLGHSDYHYNHEPIYFGYKTAKGRRGRGGEGWYGGNTETTVLEYPRPKASDDHPTMKPVALIERMLRNSSPGGCVVYDPFAGSGSTLMACETAGRQCATMEIDPVYCDVIVHRWEEATGQKAAVKR